MTNTFTLESPESREKKAATSENTSGLLCVAVQLHSADSEVSEERRQLRSHLLLVPFLFFSTLLFSSPTSFSTAFPCAAVKARAATTSLLLAARRTHGIHRLL